MEHMALVPPGPGKGDAMPQQTTRDQILQVARDAFTAKGFANASVSEICREACVSPPTLYYHFGNKEGLFEAVVEEALSLDVFCDLLRQAVAGSADPWARLRAYVCTYLARFPSHLLNPGLHFQDTTQLTDISMRRLQAGLADIYRLTRELLEEGIAAGALREVDVEMAASCLMGTVDSFVRARVYLGAEYDAEQVAASIVELYGRGLAASNAPVAG
jgi:AcrR family transcriptional regulator